MRLIGRKRFLPFIENLKLIRIFIENMKDTWHTLKINSLGLFDSYAKKYGLESDFQEVQKIQLNHPDVQSAFKQALAWASIQAGETIFDLGVNNGFELTFIEDQYKTIWPTLKVIGIDFIKEVLTQAADTFALHPNNTLIQGDARTFQGTDVITDEEVIVPENTVDIVIAVTSLQSSSFIPDFDKFITDLTKRLTSKGRMLVAVPDCHTVEGKVVHGMFDANTGAVNSKSADEFCKKLTTLMNKHGFAFKQMGTYYKFLVFSRN